SPSLLQGASRVTGGTFRGGAIGNTPNMADFSEVDPTPRGRVLLYVSGANPATVDPISTNISMAIQHKVTNHIAPILQTLKRRYSPVQSKFLFVLLNSNINIIL
ncbi:hypothetical protein BD779DRAFT_1454767, partial [Infundibulicybe gibba]